MKRRIHRKSFYTKRCFSLITEQGNTAYDYLKTNFNMSELIEDYLIYKAKHIANKHLRPLSIEEIDSKERRRQWILHQKNSNKSLEQITKEANELLKQEKK
jgi:hypothetical protein